ALHENAQKVELGGRKFALLAGRPGKLAPPGIQGPAVERVARGFGIAGNESISATSITTQDGANTRDHLAHVEGLCDVIVRTKLEAHHAVDHVSLAADHDDRHVVLCTNGSSQGEAVLAAEA